MLIMALLILEKIINKLNREILFGEIKVFQLRIWPKPIAHTAATLNIEHFN